MSVIDRPVIASCALDLIHTLRDEFLSLHGKKEDLFWAQRMWLASRDPQAFNAAQAAMEHWSANASFLPRIAQALEDNSVTGDEEIALTGWKAYFESYVITDPQASAILADLVAAETALGESISGTKTGYRDVGGEFVPASLAELRTLSSTHKDRRVRESAWKGFASMEKVVLDGGLAKIVRLRNRLARAMGYQNFYDYHLRVTERMALDELFAVLDDLESHTRERAWASAAELSLKSGASALEPWNFLFHVSGDWKAKADPYFQFSDAVSRWGRSFNALRIDYRGAEIRIDLVDRQGKYSNGFAHAPFPGFVDDGVYRPSRVNFTANAVPGQLGAGLIALNTLFHEGGHAAHFSNILMPSPAFSQEYAPTSIAAAEIHSMFLDSLIDDPQWQSRYARNEKGEAMPEALILEGIRQTQPFAAIEIRRMLLLPYFERALYSLPDEEITDKKIVELARATEKRILPLTAADRPILCFPHLWSRESSAYYHAYVLATLGVTQTREYFMKRDGRVVDNPIVGPLLTEHYWKPGNSRSASQLVQALTGAPLGASATIAEVNRTAAEAEAQAREAIARVAGLPISDRPVNLNARLYLMHGDEVVATNTDGSSFEAMAQKYDAWIRGFRK